MKFSLLSLSDLYSCIPTQAPFSQRDVHVYSPGLANSDAYQEKNQKLLEQAVGVPVRRVHNKSANNMGAKMKASNSKIARGLGKLVGGVGTALDWAYAPVNKVPGLRQVSPTTRKTKAEYAQALKDVSGRPGAKMYAWMHSEGANHGAPAIKSLVTKDNASSFKGFTFGGGRINGFGKFADVTHHVNESNGRYGFGLFKMDPVSYVAAGAGFKDQSRFTIHQGVSQVVNSYQPATDPDYVHGFPTYVETSVVPEAKEYFNQGLRDYDNQNNKP